jgi:hypothetical protein
MPHQFEQLGKGRMFVRLPSDKLGVARYIIEVADFHGTHGNAKRRTR